MTEIQELQDLQQDLRGVKIHSKRLEAAMENGVNAVFHHKR